MTSGFAMSSLAFMVDHNPYLQVQGQVPHLGSNVSVHWTYLVLILAGIASTHLVMWVLIEWTQRDPSARVCPKSGIGGVKRIWPFNGFGRKSTAGATRNRRDLRGFERIDDNQDDWEEDVELNDRPGGGRGGRGGEERVAGA